MTILWFFFFFLNLIQGIQCYSTCDVNWAMTIFTTLPLLLLLVCICICCCACMALLKRWVHVWIDLHAYMCILMCVCVCMYVISKYVLICICCCACIAVVWPAQTLSACMDRFTYKHTHKHTHIHVYLPTYLHLYIHTCIHAYNAIHAYMHIHMYACMHVHTCKCKLTKLISSNSRHMSCSRPHTPFLLWLCGYRYKWKLSLSRSRFGNFLLSRHLSSTCSLSGFST